MAGLIPPLGFPSGGEGGIRSATPPEPAAQQQVGTQVPETQGDGISGCFRTLPDHTGNFASEQGQNKDKAAAGAASPQSPSSGSREAIIRTSPSASVGLTLAYLRQSTEVQSSNDDQERVCREAAAKRGLVLLDEHIFSDNDTGQLANRPGWEAVKQLVRSGRVKAVIGYSLSRMFRSLQEGLAFWDLVCQHSVLLILAAENQELRDDDRSEQFFQLRSMIDEWYARSLGNHIHTAQETLFLGNFVFGTLTYGYCGVPVAGPETKRGRPRCQIAICQEEAT